MKQVVLTLTIFLAILLISACDQPKKTVVGIATSDQIAISSTLPLCTEEISVTEITNVLLSNDNEVATDSVEITATEPIEDDVNTEATADTRERDKNPNDLLARVIWQEAGTCSEYCQWLVGSAALNLAESRGGLEAVVFDYNTFNVAYSLYDSTPSNVSYSIAERLLEGDRDFSVMAFKMGSYHNFGTPYISVDNVYFSTY